ncbi:hypothetical protein BG015_001920 [Linnemannia schmuckeri]|uniref:Uncharacterized protein n=1 Tax=Linnemannia schmuckeri TaxID=64567 RepID=A0A9P5RP80_9FUNG|nr:hypothetical protein BG015_001920 [Linnemannia schmuckeri]
MMGSIRHYIIPYGTLGDFFDSTLVDRASKVYFEDILFETWNHDRTVLIGDVKIALDEYKDERLDAIKEQCPQSYISAKLIYGHQRQLVKDTVYRPQAISYL